MFQNVPRKSSLQKIRGERIDHKQIEQRTWNCNWNTAMEWSLINFNGYEVIAMLVRAHQTTNRMIYDKTKKKKKKKKKHKAQPQSPTYNEQHQNQRLRTVSSKNYPEESVNCFYWRQIGQFHHFGSTQRIAHQLPNCIICLLDCVQTPALH